MEEPKISIIVPCFNAQRFVDRCLRTLVAQTIGIQNLEIILINDASTDQTLSKLMQWEEKYPDHIMVVTYDENLRQGGARNIGLQYARGEYIGFVDIDDWIESDMYEQLYHYVEQGDYDIVRGRFVENKVYVNEPATQPECPHNQECHYEKYGDIYIQEIDNIEKLDEYSCGVTAIYRRSIIVEHDICFPEKLAYEDNLWGAIMALYAKDTFFLDRIVYHYFVNTNSTTTTRNAKHHFDRLTIELKKLEEYKKRGAYSALKEQIEFNFVKMYYLNSMFIFFTRFDYIPDVINEMRRTVREKFPEYNKNSKIVSLNEREKALLSLIDIPRDLTELELAKIKLAYLKTFQLDKHE